MLIHGTGIVLSISIVQFLFMFNFIALTSISREGNNSNFMKYIPISYEKQCLYKIMPGILLNIVPIFYTIIILKLAIDINIITILDIIVLTMLINIINNYIMIIIDLKNPKLEWISEYAVVKQNLNMLFQIIIILFEIGIFILSLRFFSTSQEITIFFSIMILILIFAIKKYISKKNIKLFKKII